MENRIYYIIENVNRNLRDIYLDLSGYVTYDTLSEPKEILDVRGAEAVYMVVESFTTDNKFVSSTTIEKVS